jgi:hypothetical protein
MISATDIGASPRRNCRGETLASYVSAPSPPADCPEPRPQAAKTKGEDMRRRSTASACCSRTRRASRADVLLGEILVKGARERWGSSSLELTDMDFTSPRRKPFAPTCPFPSPRARSAIACSTVNRNRHTRARCGGRYRIAGRPLNGRCFLVRRAVLNRNADLQKKTPTHSGSEPTFHKITNG